MRPLHAPFFQLIQLIASAAMFGIIWIVQIVIYPLLAEVGPNAFQHYHAEYMWLVTWIIAPLMFTEACGCGWHLLTNPRDKRVWIAAGLFGVICLSTAFIQVPQHSDLTQEEVSQLVSSNWIRTIAWSLRLFLLTIIFMGTLPPSVTKP